MRRSLRQGMLAAAAALGLVSPAMGHTIVTAPVPPRAAPAVPDVQDILYLGDRPVLIRLHLQVDGKPLAAAWDAYLEKLFRYIDRDNDGVLSAAEVKLAPKAQMLAQVRQGGFVVLNQGTSASLGDFGNPADGKVSLEAFQAYYRKAAGRPFVIGAAQNGRPQSGALNDALFKLLDTNRDGKLSQAELDAAPAVLSKLDADDDEMITAAEVLGQTGGQQQFFAPGPAAPGGQVVAVNPDDSSGVTALMNRYDRNKDQKLSREELGLDTAAFARLDANKDGMVDSAELAAFLASKPEFELTVELGKRELGKKAVESRADSSVRNAGDNVMLTVGNTQIQVERGDGQNNFNNARPFYIQQFKRTLAAVKADAAGLDAKQFQNGQLRFFPFELLDRDGNGKVSEQELVAYLDLQAEATQSFCTLQAQEGGESLFDLLDGDRDGRLSIRELRTAWQRVSAWDRDKDGCVTRAEMPRQIEMTLSRGPAGFNRAMMRAQAAMLGRVPPTRARTTKGPLWFRKMDRNDDGEVSPREFLGSAEDFRKIDTNGDGLIDADEAERANEWFARRASAKP